MRTRITITHKGKTRAATIDSVIIETSKRKNSINRRIISDVIVALWKELNT
jgi:hypothetical protein